MEASAQKHLPKQSMKANKPWIGEATLFLVSERLQARQDGNYGLERELHKQTKKSARKDRSKWLEDLAGTGDWHAMKLLKRGRKTTQTRLKDVNGTSVHSDERASAFAAHLETVQWRVRPVTLVPGSEPPLHQPLPVREGPFSQGELQLAIRSLKSGKATRNGDICIEIFKAMSVEAGPALQEFLDLFNECLSSRSFPDEWLLSRVVMIFKKNDPALPDNYRPISVLAVANQVFTSMLKQRLLNAGVDAKLWTSQFGFRKDRSTYDAIFIARRRIEVAFAQRYGRLSLVALDWKKAFDSLHLDSLSDAMRRVLASLTISLMWL